MKINTFSLAAAALALASNVSAHYIFQQLSVGSNKYPVFQYVRKNSNYNSPVIDLDSNDLRCNEGASGSGTDTVDVKAGDSITFTLDTAVYHQGPISVYMSAAGGAAADYAGDGTWFKIKDWGPTFNGGSSTWPLSITYTFNLPTCIPSGQYLLRIQSLGIHNPWPAGIPQFYISCAQINLTGGGSTVPATQVKIPGAFKETDPGYTANIYSNFNSYTIPGPAVFSCSGGNNPPASSDVPPASSTRPPTSSTRAPTTTTLTTTSRAPASSSQAPTNCAAMYAQCGGSGWTGPTCCSSGSCKKSNDWYSQCL